MKAVVIACGDRMPAEKAMPFLLEADLILCIDGGADYARFYGIIPDVVIGDMDSIQPDTLVEAAQTAVFTSKEDDTDTRMAVEYALQRGATSVDILCGTGNRLDHTQANLLLLAWLAGQEIPARLVDANNLVQVCTRRLVLEKNGCPYVYISILSLGCGAEGVTLEGFRYPLRNQSIPAYWTQGISNQLEADRGTVEVQSGMLLVICSERI